MTQVTSYLELFEAHTGSHKESARTYMMASPLGSTTAIDMFERALQRGDQTVTFDRWTLIGGRFTHEGDHMIRTDQIVGVNRCQRYTDFINWEIPKRTMEEAFERIYGISKDEY